MSRMQRIVGAILLSLVIALAVVSSVSAHQVKAQIASAPTQIIAVDGRPDYTYQRWVNRSRIPTPPIALPVFESTPCPPPAPRAESCTQPMQGQDIYGEWGIWLEPLPSLGAVRWILMHEIGHNFDRLRMAETSRSAFEQMLGLSGVWGDANADPIPAEVFADVYSACSLGPFLRPYQVQGVRVGPKLHQHLCQLIASQA